MENKFDCENKSCQRSIKELRVTETLLLRICEDKVFAILKAQMPAKYIFHCIRYISVKAFVKLSMCLTPALKNEPLHVLVGSPVLGPRNIKQHNAHRERHH